MNRKTGLFAAGLAVAASAALAHTGATGVVLERMQGMTALRDVMRDLTPMMQGAAPYDAVAVSEAGYVIASHSGEAMQKLFPTDSLMGVTYAKPDIWSDWQEFANLSEELRTYAEALSSAASAGLQAPESVPMMMDDTATETTQTAPTPESLRAQQVANLMGFTPPEIEVGVTRRMSTDTFMAQPVQQMGGTEDIFAQISGTCSACHAKFRTGRN